MGDPEEKEKEEDCLFTVLLAKYVLSLLFDVDIQVYKIQRSSRRETQKAHPDTI